MIQWFIKRIVFFTILLLYSCSHEGDVPCVSTSLFPAFSIIYEGSPKYVAFCDIVKFKDKFYTAFRKGEDHAPYHDYSKNGYIVILSSDDCENWHKEIELKDDKWDLRDPCFCVDPTGDTLHVYYGRYSYFTPEPDKKTGVFVLHENDGKLYIYSNKSVDMGDYSPFWLWKISKHKEAYYGVAYKEKELPALMKSKDGVHFSLISLIPQAGNETSLEFDGENLYCFIRNDTPKSKAFVARSRAPFISWEVKELDTMIESPESFTKDGNMYITGRSMYGMSTFLYDKQADKVVPILNYFALGEYGNIGYPGIIVHNQKVYVVYYAESYDRSHTCIYETIINNL